MSVFYPYLFPHLSKKVLKAIFLVILLSCCLTLEASASEPVDLPNYSMKLSIETDASKATIWALWADVKNWKQFDERLEYSFLVDDAPFEKSAIGYVKGKGAPKTKFILTKVEIGVSFTEVLKLPLWQTVHLQRYFEKSLKGKTIFTHEVNFKGGLKSVYYRLLARAFKKDLKLVMEKMKVLAENKETQTIKQTHYSSDQG